MEKVSISKIRTYFSSSFIQLILAGFFIRIGLSFFGTYQLDHNTFIAWGRMLSDVGFSNFYSSGWSDYLPGYLYMLRILAESEAYIEIPTVLLYKLPAIAGDLITSFFIYSAVKTKYSENKALLSSAAFIFNPAVFANSTIWGQVDTFSSLFTVSALYFLPNIFLSSLLLAVGGSIKPQAAMAIPIIIALMLKEKWGVNKIASYFGLLLIFFVLIFIPFSDDKNLFLFITNRVSVTLGQYPYGSVNAFNFWGLWGFWKPDNLGLINPKIIGSVLVLLLSIWSFFIVFYKSDKKYIALAFLLLVNFLFLTRMHERHLLPVFAPLAIAAATSSYLWLIYTVLSFTYIANLAYAYQFIEKNKTFYIPEYGVSFIILINLVMFILFLAYFFFDKEINFKKFFAKYLNSSNSKFERDLVNRVKAKKLIFIIILLTLLSRIVLVGYPNDYYFDEIYHGFTARAILHGDPKPWHWSSEHPEGFAYEWTHPPLGKEIMAASMFALGESHFAARLPGALLGVGIVYLTYLLSLFLTKRHDISLIASFMIATDGLMFTMSRISTVDIYFVFFAIATLYFLLREKYFVSALFLGFSFATKWSSLWLLPILAVSFIVFRPKFEKSILIMLILPPIIYLASYIPMFYFSYDIETFIGMQKQMWWYHSGLDATHSYASSWWTWPLNLRPVYLYQLDNKDGWLGNIYAMGNPFFFWFGIIAVILIFYLLLNKKLPKVTGFILFAYLAFFVPWAASPRIMFIYHYLPSLPFLAILSAIVIRKFPKFIVPMLLLLSFTFIYFYPHWTGLAVPEWYSKQYYWIKGWR